jgi:hypothetical protein
LQVQLFFRTISLPSLHLTPRGIGRSTNRMAKKRSESVENDQNRSRNRSS